VGGGLTISGPGGKKTGRKEEKKGIADGGLINRLKTGKPKSPGAERVGNRIKIQTVRGSMDKTDFCPTGNLGPGIGVIWVGLVPKSSREFKEKKNKKKKQKYTTLGLLKVWGLVQLEETRGEGRGRAP